MDIDLRTRVDSKGERHGKVVKHRFSELRTINVMEQTCRKLDEEYHFTVDESERPGKVYDGAYMTNIKTVEVDGETILPNTPKEAKLNGGERVKIFTYEGSNIKKASLTEQQKERRTAYCNELFSEYDEMIVELVETAGAEQDESILTDELEDKLCYKWSKICKNRPEKVPGFKEKVEPMQDWLSDEFL